MVDDEIVFDDFLYPTYIIPDLIAVELSPGWHKLSAKVPELDLKMTETFFTPIGSHLDLYIIQQKETKEIYLLNSWTRRYYH